MNETTKITVNSNMYIELKKQISSRLEMLKEVKKKIDFELKKMPEGKMTVANHKTYTQYYIRLNTKEKNGKYVSKKEKETIKKYLQKDYDIKVLKLVEHEIKGLERMQTWMFDSMRNMEGVYESYPADAKEVISPITLPFDEYAKNWKNEDFTGKEILDGQPMYVTNNGERVRSKSELNIANYLHKKSIPYKYECPLRLKNGALIYPDFTILSPKTRNIVYWEHRGMMDDRDYAKHSVIRIKDYMKSGIILGKQLIITEEVMTHPLGTDEIKMIVNEYLF